MVTSKKVALGAVVVATSVTIAAVLFISLPATWHNASQAFYIPLAGSLFFSLLDVGGALLFLTNLKSYKPELRSAYKFIVAGIVINSIATLQIPAMNILNGWQSAWVTKGGIGLPFVISAIVWYIGSRQLARATKVKSKLTNPLIALPPMIACMALSFLLPHVSPHVPLVALRLSNMVAVVPTFMYLWSAVIVTQIRQHIGSHYVKSLTWMAVALYVIASISVFIIINALFTGDPNGTAPTIVISQVLSGILVFLAGYAFSQTADYAQLGTKFDVIFGGTPKPAQAITSALDLVTYTAGFVSQPAAVDAELDQVRTITALLEPGQAMSARDEQALLKVYLQLEDYLMTKEPLRTFTRNELRRPIGPELSSKLKTMGPADTEPEKPASLRLQPAAA